MNTHLPFCLSPLQAHWPLPVALPGTILVSTRFDPSALQGDDFGRCAVPAPPSIQRSVAKRQAEFLAGRLCARAALRAIGGPDQVPAIGEDRAPVWPSGVTGSITHSAGYAAAIVAHRADWRGLGLDAETLLAPERALRLAGEILTPAELLRLQAGPQALAALHVTLTFSLKESLFKALYPLVGTRFYFEHAEVIEWSPDGQARLRLLTDLSAEFATGVELAGQFCVEQDRLLSLVAVC